MKPQDLRIGNYVKVNGSNEIVQICAINEEKVGVYYKGGEPRIPMFVPCFDIEPVLIREVYNSLPYIKDLERAGRHMYSYKNVLTAYFHELQNIHYALTGNEIEDEI